MTDACVARVRRSSPQDDYSTQIRAEQITAALAYSPCDFGNVQAPDARCRRGLDGIDHSQVRLGDERHDEWRAHGTSNRDSLDACRARSARSDRRRTIRSCSMEWQLSA